MTGAPKPGTGEQAATPLREDTLESLPHGIAKPRYRRDELSPGIVHIGVGNFHRAHQAWYLHRLMQQGDAKDWAIIGAGVRQNDAVMREKLAAQDFLTTLIELSPDGTSAEVAGSMIDFLPVEDDNGALIAQVADPRHSDRVADRDRERVLRESVHGILRSRSSRHRLRCRPSR